MAGVVVVVVVVVDDFRGSTTAVLGSDLSEGVDEAKRSDWSGMAVRIRDGLDDDSDDAARDARSGVRVRAEA